MRSEKQIYPASLRMGSCAVWCLLILSVILSGCASVDLGVRQPVSAEDKSDKSVAQSSSQSAARTAGKGRGGYYQDDGPGEQIPEGLLETPDATPRVEPFARGPAKPYAVFGKTYTPITDNRPFVQRGIGSWYGKKFHGQRTASGEIYDMFKMTAAHPILPIPSYVRVTNLRNNRQVIVRVNDRGPFHSDRIIDLSYTAALKLGYVGNGSSELQVERLLPDEIARINAAKNNQSVATTISPVNEADEIARIATSGSSARVAAETGGFYLQFGAYAQSQNAQVALDKLMPTWPASLPAPSIVQEQGLYRLRSGPFAVREEAARAAGLLQSNAKIGSTVVQK